jgi:hypothetical protein
MSAVIKASVALAVLVEIVSVIFSAAGLHEKGILPGIVLLVVFIALNVGCVFWALKQTAEDNGYGKQLLNAAVFGLIAGVLIVGFAMLNLTVFFPDYLEESQTATIEFLEGMEMPAEALQAQVAKQEARTAWGDSMNGGIGTFFTSLIVGAIIAIFKRKK